MYLGLVFLHDLQQRCFLKQTIGFVIFALFIYWSIQQQNKSTFADDSNLSTFIEQPEKPPQCYDPNPWIKLPENAYNVYWRPDWVKFQVKGITYQLNVHTGEYLHWAP